jgi:hypothetical protein
MGFRLKKSASDRHRTSPPETRNRSPVTPERATGTDDDYRVLPFRPRNATSDAGHGSHGSLTAGEPAASPVKDLSKYEAGGDSEDNYRHRMMVNLAALLVTVVLSIAGVWLAIEIVDMRKTQDCVLSGRRNCMPIDVKTLER